MSQHSFWSVVGLSSILMFGAIGCGQSGPQLATVEGEVLLDGQPLPAVLVEFQPEAVGSPSLGVTDENGKFRLQFSQQRRGALLGRHTVKVVRDADGREGAGEAPLPARYGEHSELKREVVAGSNFFKLELQNDVATVSWLR